MQAAFAKESGKTVVFCFSGDEFTKRRMERAVVVDMRNRGFDTYEGRAMVLPAKHYSAQDLASLLAKNNIQSIGEITFMGNVSLMGLPDNMHFNLHTLPKTRGIAYPQTQTTLDQALIGLLETADQASHR